VRSARCSGGRGPCPAASSPTSSSRSWSSR
jgi:hypothetical protein